MSVRRALVISSITKYSTTIIGLASMMIIARLLTPTQIGTFAIGSAIILTLTEFRVLGAGQYLIRQSAINSEDVRSALGLTIIVSWGIGICVISASIPFAKYYNIPDLAPIFWILSVGFIFGPHLSINTALLTRNMRFESVFRIRFYSSLLSIFATLFLIFLGYGYFSLAWGQAVLSLVAFILIIFLRAPEMVWIPKFSKMGPIASFGIFNSTGNLLKKSVVTVPDLIIGKLGTPAQVGLFSRGLGFIEFLSQNILMGIQPVILPYFSGKKRESSDISSAYVQSSVLLGGLLWPVLAVASVVSLPAIRLFFGDQWDHAAPFASVLAFWAMLRGVHWFSSDYLIAHSEERLMVLKELVSFLVYASGMFLAFPFGLWAVALSFVFSGIFEFFVVCWILSVKLKVSQKQLLTAWVPNLIVTLMCLVAALFLDYYVSSEAKGGYGSLLLTAAVLPFVWVGGLFLTKHALSQEVYSLVRTLPLRARFSNRK